MSEQVLDEIKDWLKTHKEWICPLCQSNTKVKASLFKGTFWCPTCNKFWQVQKSKLTGVHSWFYKEITERLKDRNAQN